MLTKGQKIKELRIKKNLSLTELGELMKVSHTTIANWEDDDPVPKKEKLKKLASIFKVPDYYLYNDDFESPNDTRVTVLEQSINDLQKNTSWL